MSNLLDEYHREEHRTRSCPSRDTVGDTFRDTTRDTIVSPKIVSPNSVPQILGDTIVSLGFFWGTR